MKTILIIPMMMALLFGCASDGKEKEESTRTKGMQVTAGNMNTVDCPSRNSTCYANVRRACGDLGVEEVKTMDRGRVSTAGRTGSTDDPFERAERQRTYDEPVSLRCRAKPASE